MLIGIAIFVVVILFVCILWFVPVFQANRLGTTVDLEKRMELENEFRKTIAQILGGVLLVIGFFFTWQQVMVTKERDVTDRFSKAIAHLDSLNTHVRIGGIYEFERIMKDFPAEEEIVFNILTAFIKYKSKWTGSDIPEEIASDIQAAFGVVGKHSKTIPCQTTNHIIDISNIDIRRSRLVDGNLSYARMLNVHSDSADLENIDLSYAQLQGSVLDGANLRNANMKQADLSYVSIKGVHFEGANLKGVKGLSIETIKKDAYIDTHTILPD